MEHESLVFTRLDLYARVENVLEEPYRSSRNTAAFHVAVRDTYREIRAILKLKRWSALFVAMYESMKIPLSLFPPVQ